MKENEFQRKIVKILKRDGAMILNIHGHAMQQAGWPDLFVAHRSWHGFIELKTKKRQLTTLQRIIMKRLQERFTNTIEMRLSEDEKFVLIRANFKDDNWVHLRWIDINRKDFLAAILINDFNCEEF